VKFWNTETWSQVPIHLPGAVPPVKFSPDGRWLLTSAQHQLQLWDTETWQPAATCPIKGFFTWPMNVAFSPDSRFLVNPTSMEQEGFNLRSTPDLNLVPGIDRIGANLRFRSIHGGWEISSDGPLTGGRSLFGILRSRL